MSTYRTGNHWGVTIVREGTEPSIANGYHRPDDQLVAVVVNGDQALAERICALLNGGGEAGGPRGVLGDMSDLALRFAATKVRAIRPGVEPQIALAVIQALLVLGWQPPAIPPADSCTCTKAGPDPACVVHQGRRAKGPKPPPVGADCTCDGSGPACPRHGVVL